MDLLSQLTPAEIALPILMFKPTDGQVDETTPPDSMSTEPDARPSQESHISIKQAK